MRGLRGLRELRALGRAVLLERCAIVLGQLGEAQAEGAGVVAVVLGPDDLTARLHGARVVAVEDEAAIELASDVREKRGL